MSTERTDTSDETPTGLVERLVRDDLDRKRFLKLAGSGAAASFGAFVLAACGSSKSPPRRRRLDRVDRVRILPPSGDVAIANYALTLEYLETEFYEKVVASGLFSGKRRGSSRVRRPGEDARRSAQGRGLQARRHARGAADGQVPDRKREAGHRTRLHRREPRRGRVPRPGGEDPEPRTACRRARDPLGRGAHAATLGTLVGKSLTPDGAFAKPADMATVLAAVKPFLA